MPTRLRSPTILIFTLTTRTPFCRDALAEQEAARKAAKKEKRSVRFEQIMITCIWLLENGMIRWYASSTLPHTHKTTLMFTEGKRKQSSKLKTRLK